MTFAERLDELGRFDIAGVTDPHRNYLRRLHLAGRDEEAERQIAWWEEAFGEGRSDLGDRVHAIRGNQSFAELLQPFGRSSEGLKPAFELLSAAIETGSLQRFRRRRFIASVYMARVECFVDRLATIEQVSQRRTRLASLWDGHSMRRFRILDAHLTARRERLPDITSSPARALANDKRRLDVFATIQGLEDCRAEQIRRRSELLELVSAQLGAHRPADFAASSGTLAGDIRMLEGVLHRASVEAERAKAAADADRVSQALRRSLGFPVHADSQELMSGMTKSLARDSVDATGQRRME